MAAVCDEFSDIDRRIEHFHFDRRVRGADAYTATVGNDDSLMRMKALQSDDDDGYGVSRSQRLLR